MQAVQALAFLEQVLKDADVEDYKFRLLIYNASLPAWVHGEEIPPPPEPPDWLSNED